MSVEENEANTSRIPLGSLYGIIRGEPGLGDENQKLCPKFDQL